MTAGLLGTVGRVSLSAAVMILAVAVLRLRFQDRTPRRAFCLLWDIVLVRLLVLAEFPSPVSIRRWLPALSQVRDDAPAMVSAVTPETVLKMDYMVVQEAYVSSVAEDTALSAGVRDLPAALALDWGTVLAVLWLAGVAVLAVWLLWGHLRGRRIYAASLPLRDDFVRDWLEARPLRRPVQVRTSGRIAAPLTYGVLYPVILLPAGMDRTDRQVLSCVLEHEYQHIRRFDALRKGLLAAALCLHWFNPLVWAMYILANRDIELACDEAVLRSGADREGYALALLGLEERRGRWSPSGSHFSQNALEERIKAIMKRKHISITALIAVLVVMCITTTVFATAAPEENSTPRQESQNQNAPVAAYVETEKDDSVMMMSNGENGEKLYSVDGGKTWMSEESYQAKYGSWGDDWQVEWWTYEEYKAWLEQEKKNLQEVIGSQGWTPSTGWFTWDQQRVDETVAMYEEILEKIKNGALYSKSIIDKNGNEVEDAMLGSDAPLDMVIAATFDEGTMVSTAPISVDKTALLDELKAFGIGGNANLMTYNGQLIRTFVDGAPVGNTGYSVQYVYTNSEGTVDVHTLRSVIYNPDGSYDTMGDLIGVVSTGDKGFDQELIDAASWTGGPEATTTQHALPDGGNDTGGKTFKEIFAQYEEYGLTYVPAAGGIGNLYCNGQLVNHFTDLKPDGSAFSFSSTDGGELYLYAEYDRNGVFTGLKAEVVPARDISTEKRDLGFDYCAPVQGRLSADFGQGRLSFHYGIDLAAEKGTDIAAFAYGVVSEVGFDATLGSYVVIDHVGGYSTLYGHCGSVAVSKGDTVAMGGKIAEVGSSGSATGAVLHFELRDGTTYLDPAQYLDMDSLI